MFQPMRVLEFIIGHVVYNLAYNKILLSKETNTNSFPLFRSVENLLNKEGDNAPGIPIGASVAHCANEGLLATIDGRRRISSCSGYSTATGKI